MTYKHSLKFALTLITAALVALAGCGAPAEDPDDRPTEADIGVGKHAQSSQCDLQLHTNQVLPVPPSLSYSNGTVAAKVKVWNFGTQSCPYRISVDFFDHPYTGTVLHATPIVSAIVAGNQAVINTHIQTNVPLQRRCLYRVWLKYPNTPAGTFNWHDMGLYEC